jgi:hypothetical protein
MAVKMLKLSKLSKYQNASNCSNFDQNVQILIKMRKLEIEKLKK